MKNRNAHIFKTKGKGRASHIPKLSKATLVLSGDTAKWLLPASVPPRLSLLCILPSQRQPCPMSRLQIRPIDPRLKYFNGVIVHTPSVFKKRFPMTVNASSATNGASPSNDDELLPETKDESVSADKLPLESEMQQRQERKLRMKLAKKIRLCRKQLLRKQKMRKKGRWPPPKMKKLKNDLWQVLC